NSFAGQKACGEKFERQGTKLCQASQAQRTETRMSSAGAAPAPILTEAELRLLQALVYQECGMHFDERRTHFLQDRLLRRLKECRVDSFYAYYRLLISQQGKE